MTILVTGGAGFIGSHIIDRLLERGDHVVCLDDFNDAYDPAIKGENVSRHLDSRKGQYTLYRGSILDRDLIEDVFRTHEPAVVLHLAARAGVMPSLAEPLLYTDVNVRGTVTVLDAAVRSKVQQFIFASSSSVYAGNPVLPFHEDHALRPISPYGASKVAAESMCYAYHRMSGMAVTVLRLFNAYGPRMRPDLAIPKFLCALESGTPLALYGDPESARDYTHVDDIVDGVLAVIARPFAFQVLNLGGSCPVSLSRLLELLERETGKRAVVQRKPARTGEPHATYADITRAHERLGWAPRIGIEEGIRTCVDHSQ